MSHFPAHHYDLHRSTLNIPLYDDPTAENDSEDKYTPLTYGLVSPSAMHAGAVAAEQGVRLLRFAGRGLGGGTFGAGGGSAGTGAGYGGLNFNRAIVGTPAEFIGPSVAPTTFQSIRGGVNQIGIRGGAMVAELGLRSLAQTTGALAEENAAAHGVSGSEEWGQR